MRSAPEGSEQLILPSPGTCLTNPVNIARMVDARKTTKKGGNLAFLKDLATVVPIVHILTACFYLFGYAQGFGHHVIAFIAIGDVFVASLRAVGQVYLFLALPPLVFMIQRSRKRGGQAGVILYSFLALAAVVIVALILASQSSPLTGRSDTANISLILIPVLLIVLLAGLVHADKRAAFAGGLSQTHVAIFTVLLFMFALLFGFNKGATDRGRQFAQSENRFFSCFDGRERRFVMRSMGSHYLALGPDNRWALVDEDCNVRFFLGDSPPASVARRMPGLR